MFTSYLTGQFYCCLWCNKKYKTTSKFQKHVESIHPFVALNENDKKLSLKNKLYLLKSFEYYSNLLLSDININTENMDDFIKRYLKISEDLDDSNENIDNDLKFIQVSHMLNPTTYISNAISVDISSLKRMVNNHLLFRERVINSHLLNKILSDESQIQLLLEEFKLFLNLGQPWEGNKEGNKEGNNFCLSLFIDLIWHSAMTNPKKYKKLCKKFLGKTLPHCLLENDNDKERFSRFERQFIHKHKRPCLKIDDLNISFCEISKSCENSAISRLRKILEEKKLVKEEESRRKNEREEEEERREENEREEERRRENERQIRQNEQWDKAWNERQIAWSKYKGEGNYRTFDDGKC